MFEPDPPTQPEPSSQGGAKAKMKVSIEEYRSRQAAKEKERRDRESEHQLDEEQPLQIESIEAQKVEQACLHEIIIQEAEIARIKHEQEQLHLEQEHVQKELEVNAELLASQAQQVPVVLGSHTPCYDEHGQELDYHDDVPVTTDSQEYKNGWSDYFRQHGDEYGAQIAESLDAECKLLQGPTMTSTASEEAVLLKEETPTVDMRQFLAGLETLTPAMLSELSTHIEHLSQLAAPLASTTSSSTQKDQQKRFIRLIYENQEVFSLHDGDLGYCDKLKHSIPTTTNKPVYLPHRQIPIQLQSEVRKCLDAWLKAGIIRPSKSPYASQVVIICKKMGEICLCVDFRKLNAISIRDSFPLPRIEEALQAVQAAIWFSSFDLAQGYLQMAMEEEDIHKMAFRAGSSGLYEFTRMPFGLTNAGASFCHLMEMCIGDQQYITLLFYLDDICVFAETADQMLDRIQLVFNRLKEFSLKIKPKKSHFFQAEVDFLGHVLSKNGVSPNPEKIEKVRDWPTPTSSKEVHSFIGLASYYRRFIPNFAKWAGPLHALIIPASTQYKVRTGLLKRSDLPEFKWTEECEIGFNNLKQALISAPILAYPDYSREFILETDASLKGLGTVLSQRGDDSAVRVIAYARHSLRPGEKSM